MKIIKSSAVYESKARTGTAKFWANHIYQDGLQFFTGSSHWSTTQDGEQSKVTFAEPYEASSKNVGRTNATSPLEQARLEFDATIKKQEDRGYRVQGTAVNVTTDPLPMLAHKFTDRKQGLVYPVFVQPKLDGMRMLSNGERGWSRGNKAILPEVFAHLKLNAFGLTLDGELILPGNVPLQETMSAAKKYRKGISDQLCYWIYDVVDSMVPYRQRYAKLELFMAARTDGGRYILTPTYECQNEAEVMGWHQQFVSQGFEGTIIRNPNANYEIGHRSTSLLKLKDSQDEEFEIVEVLEGGGVSLGQAIFKLKTPEGLTFDSTPQATHEQRREWFVNRNSLIGQYATVKFFGKTKDKIPTFNNTIAIRSKEDFSCV